jgi:hypothetical protein
VWDEDALCGGHSRGAADEVLAYEELVMVADLNELSVMSHGLLEAVNELNRSQTEARLGTTVGDAWAPLDRVNVAFDAADPLSRV